MIDCDTLENPPPRIESPYVKGTTDGNTVILVTPKGDERFYNGKVHITLTLPHAVTRLEPGVTLKLLPGKYYNAVDLVRKKGIVNKKKGIVNKKEDKPIIIEGTCAPDGTLLSHLCGTNAAGSIYPDLPNRDDCAFFRLRECKHIIFRNLKAESCWPSFIYAEATSHLTVEGLNVTDGSYVLFARGPDSHDLHIKDCTWNQDPTGSLWNQVDWGMTHHGPYAYYNGALAGGVDVHGNIEVSGNTVRNAFNGVRFTTSSKNPKSIVGRFNVNVRVHHNTFENIRDNAVEPENTLLNWHIHDNRIKNAHAAFSIHDFTGGFLYIYANELWFDDRGGSDYQENRGGKIYKLRHKGPLPQWPVHIFHNSIYSRNFLIKKARSKNLYHRNNAVQFCSPDDHAKTCLCRDDREFLRKFPVDKDEEALPWDPSVVFDGDASTKPFGELKDKQGQEANGIVHSDLGFTDPRHGCFKPTEDSPLRQAGRVFELREGVDLPPGQPSWSNGTPKRPPDIGSAQSANKLTLPYVPMTPETVAILLGS